MTREEARKYTAPGSAEVLAAASRECQESRGVVHSFVHFVFPPLAEGQLPVSGDRGLAVWSGCLFADGEATPQAGLSLGVLALIALEGAQALEAERHFGVALTESLLLDGQRPLVKRLCLRMFPLVGMEIAQADQTVRDVNVLRAKKFLTDLESPPIERLGFRVPTFVAEKVT